MDLSTQLMQGSSNDGLVRKHVKPYPFAFITALKRKLEISGYSDNCKKAREPSKNKQEVINLDELNVNLNQRQTFSQSNKKMDLIKPLKVPDLKVTPKILDYSMCESSSLSEASLNKFDMLSKDYIPKQGKAAKTLDRVQRKLDFSSSNLSLLNDENVEGLETLDFSVQPNVVKKKDYLRDNSKEKENRSKRIKRDDSSISKADSSLKNISKRIKNMEHVSRKDVSGSVVKKIRNESFLYSLPRETDFGLKKQKAKNSATSIMKKDEDKTHRCLNTQHYRSGRDKHLELKGRSFSKDSINLPERNAVSQDKTSTTCSDLLEEVDVSYNSHTSFTKYQMYSEPCEIPSKVSKVKEVEKSVRNLVNQSNQQNIHRNLATEDFSLQNNSNNENSKIHSVTLDRIQGAMNSESKRSINTSLSEILFDPRRISFRDDSYLQQEDFSNLVTPDINLMLRSKRRKQFLQENSKNEVYKCLKNKPKVIEDDNGEGIRLLHPNALHMQFQAELNLLESFNESLSKIMDVESSIYNAKHAEDQKLLQKEKLAKEEFRKQLDALQTEKEVELDNMEALTIKPAFYGEGTCLLVPKACDGFKAAKKDRIASQKDVLSQVTSKRNSFEKMDNNVNKSFKSLVKVAEVQTQTANDIATQTDLQFCKSKILSRLEELSGITYQRGPSSTWDIPRLSLESLGQEEDIGQVDDISLTSKIRGMSEISLHETTSSIKTETGTEISISTRDVTCSFNKDLELEMAQLIQDEKQRYDKIKMIFKSREKILNDRTKKLVKLEEQKRQLRDTGQDSRISSVKKKQRALLLKLQQEKDEMNRLKELHKIASQERKLMLKKQRDMFNPEMSTKNILTKLKRSADSQSPRRLSGPMKGYDIRSNSSMSSLVDSDKSQIDRSQVDVKLHTFNIGSKKDDEHYVRLHFNALTSEKSGTSKFETIKGGKVSASASFCKPHMIKAVKKSNYDITSRKFEEKMPRADILRQIELHSQLQQGSIVDLPVQNQETKNVGWPPTYQEYDTDCIRSKETKRFSSIDEISQINGKCSKKIEKSLLVDKDDLKKVQCVSDTMSSSKRKGTKSHKTKSTSNVVKENFLRSESDSQVWEEVNGPHNKRSKLQEEQSNNNYRNSVLEELDSNESQSSLRALLKHSKAAKDKNYQLLRDLTSDREKNEEHKVFEALDNKDRQLEDCSQMEDKGSANMGNISTRSQVSTLTISHHSSGDSEQNYSRSVVISSQNHRFETSKKLEQILNAREAALASRRTCVEEWIAWHTRLREEENRVARMEQTAYNVVNAASKALSCHDTTVSSDMSDVEGRIEVLAQKLSQRRTEMAMLKKEEKRQAKQRLRDMEASLLDQIKKYDATIHEMRKTLETKKESVRNTEKSAIESKSVIDFKVPEIPIKRMHEIYRSSDLLQSISTPDLIKNKAREGKSLSTNICENACNKDTVHLKLQENVESKQLIFEDDSRNEPRQDYTMFNDFEKNNEVNSSISRQDSVLNNALFQQSIINESKSIKSSCSQISVTSKSLYMPEISEAIDSISNPTEPEINVASVAEAVQSYDAENVSLSFSRKLDYIDLNSQNLNDDIITLENDLKRLSEMMLQISNKSVSKGKQRDEEEDYYSEKRTSEDISEYLPETESIEHQSSKCFLKHLLGDQGETIKGSKNSDNNVEDDVNDDADRFRKMSVNYTSLISSTQKIDYNARSKEMLNEIEKCIISDHIKSLEIQSQLSDHTLEEEMHNLSDESQVFSNDLTSLDGNIKFVSEIISKPSQNENTFDKSLNDIKEKEPLKYCADNTTKSRTISGSYQNSACESPENCTTLDNSKMNVINIMIDDLDIPASTVLNEEINIQKNDLLQSTMQVSDGTGGREAGGYSTQVQVESSTDKPQYEYIEEHIEIEKASVYDDWEISDSFELHNMKKKTKRQKEDDNLSCLIVVPEDKQQTNFEKKENPSIDKKILGHHDNLTAEIDVIGNDIMFIPWGESANNETLDVSFENVELYGCLDRTKSMDKEDEEQTNLTKKQMNDQENLSSEWRKKMKQENCKDLRIKEKGENECKSISFHDSPGTISKDASSIYTSINSMQQIRSIVDSHQRKANVNSRLHEATPSINICLETECLEGHDLIKPKLQLRVMLSDCFKTASEDNTIQENILKERVKTSECLRSLEEQDSSEGEQLDNLVEVVEDKLETLETVNDGFSCNSEKLEEIGKNITDNQKLFSVLRNPQYEDISEESLEVSLISENTESLTPQKAIPKKYKAVRKAEDVVKILDEMLAKSVSEIDELTVNLDIESQQHQLSKNDYERKAVEEQEDISVKVSETDDSSESSESDLQRNTFENSVALQKDSNDSRLDIDALDDDLLSGVSIHQNFESNTDFPVTPIVTNAEQDITAMIDKLKASLTQPGLEVAELDATLLRIEQLQIELEIKILEAEEVSYYVREIPNKPPPPYTPPGAGMVAASHSSPSRPPEVIPSNVDDLTAFTEKATSFIFNVKKCGEDFGSLEAPPEIWDISKDSEALKKDRRIYNAFLFDLCKETITEVYRIEHEQPGPSWMRPSVKTTPVIKAPNNVNDLTEYVNKEVSTLFGFKTKLQRENMVMRWSRKRRDRVDELLAREAQAEEDEWTKFHCDELAVKNELTVAILDSLVLDTVNVVKTAFTKRSKLTV
ncbi:uncharacterized protein LOC117179148 [Belonocnema kinseyi]|uniref:uncharacterized protein LOC117179148 n=1 Tax=Belonocnema kinseyi TaxID=2817044 RepID=UPI00143CD14A|nr:uncharacterized protein LOC117179148 [Belonocnema kinseyi]XP_033226727.1 uncharacterized protein LOC117179148 [Belonocnema kinseyi]